MPYQTSYTQFQSLGLPGMQADMSEWDASTKTATATIAFGAPVQRNGDESCTPFTTGEYIGIAKAMHKVSGSVADSYEQYDNVPGANEGVWLCVADAAIRAEVVTAKLGDHGLDDAGVSGAFAVLAKDATKDGNKVVPIGAPLVSDGRAELDKARKVWLADKANAHRA